MKIATASTSYIEHVIYEHIHWRGVDKVLIQNEIAASCSAAVEKCTAYRSLKDSGVVLDSGEALVPSYLFKGQSLRMDGYERNQLKACTSSGTLGTKSVVYRDDKTLERFAGSVSYGISQFLGRDHSRRRAFVLGPNAVEAGDLWFSYVLSLVEIVYKTDFYGSAGRVDFVRLYGELKGENYYQPILVGPPSLIVDFVKFLKRSNLELDLGVKEAYIITAGGWKNRVAEQISSLVFRGECSSFFSLDPSRIRDSFNMVELNSVMFECEHHRMHVPPWLRVEAVDPITMAATGDEGVLAFLDPTAVSYPSFILSEDLGTLAQGICPCGIDGEWLSFNRRVKANEQRGCATKMSLFDET